MWRLGTFSICIGSPAAARRVAGGALSRGQTRAGALLSAVSRADRSLALNAADSYADNVRQVLKGEPYPLDRFLVVAAGHYAIYRHAESFGDRMSLALAHLDPNSTRVQVKGPNRIEIARGGDAVDRFLVDDSTAWLAAFTEELEATAAGVGATDDGSDGESDAHQHRQSVVSFGLFEPGATSVVDLSPSPTDGDAVSMPRLLRPDGGDLALANTVLPAILVDVSSTALGIAINDDLLPLERLSLLGCALVLRTGQGGRTRGAQPFVRLTTAKKLIASGVKLVAIDCPSLGAPDDESNELHTRLSQANISIALNLGGDIAQLPVDTKFALHMVPLSAVVGAARAYAVVLNDEKCQQQQQQDVKAVVEPATEAIEEKSTRSDRKKSGKTKV
jgi:hypothetical protein